MRAARSATSQRLGTNSPELHTTHGSQSHVRHSFEERVHTLCSTRERRSMLLFPDYASPSTHPLHTHTPMLPSTTSAHGASLPCTCPDTHSVIPPHTMGTRAEAPRTSRPVPAGAVENWPATQSLHDVAPATAYRPDAHMAAGGLADVDAAGHAYPAAHTAVHVDTDKPCVLPYLPAGQSVQPLATAVDEYRPTAHSVHDPAKHTTAHTRRDKGTAATLTCCPSSAFAKDVGAPPAHGGGRSIVAHTRTLRGPYLLVPSRTGPPHSHCTTSPRPPHTDPTHTWRQEGSPT
jgi:hypothetical protein